VRGSDPTQAVISPPVANNPSPGNGPQALGQLSQV
jgi:hypothetical protein